MFLRNLQIVNYKNLANSTFKFKEGVNTIIGENDSGKSNAMTALRILLDSSFFYNNKRLKEQDFADKLGNWKGHWIILSACFDGISETDKSVEVCKDIVPNDENASFLKSFIRCQGFNYGTITLFIRPRKSVRKQLYDANGTDKFDEVREQITLEDYEFFYAGKSQAVFTDISVYETIVGNLSEKQYSNPELDDASILGTKIDILEVWQYISVVFIEALRDVHVELKKTQNPIRRIVDTIKADIEDNDIDEIKNKIRDLNAKISEIAQISDIGNSINNRLQETIGMVYSPDIKIESQMRDDMNILSKYLSMTPSKSQELDYLGLGHLNMIFIALKLVEFDYRKNRELMNIMIIEEPEAHIHTHIQKTLFNNLQISKNYTQVLMTTHSTHLSEVADISRVNILKSTGEQSIVMQPTNGLNDFGAGVLEIEDVTLDKCLERYLDAKRSVLLFSKGVMLVEGDGEEILIPNLVKKVLGISLDELGIGLINIGSVGFENVASIFHCDRLQRKCAIITDSDVQVEGATKQKERAEKTGTSRKEKLEKLFGENEYVGMFFAPHTLEFDFAVIKDNHTYIKKIIDHHYKQAATKQRHKDNLTKSEGKIYDTIMILADAVGKGWYSVLLSEYLDALAIIPNYIIEALAFATQEIITVQIKSKICFYSLNKYSESEKRDNLIGKYNKITDKDFIQEFIVKYPHDMATIFVKACEQYE